MIVSKRFTFIKQDWSKWLKNLFIFSIPSILSLINYLTGAIKVDPKWYPVFIMVANALIDWLKKYASEHSYKV